MTLWDRMVAFNTQFNNLPRKFFLIALVLGACYICVMLFPLFAPFFVAALIAMMMNPLVRLLRHVFKRLPMKNALATFLAMILVYGLIGFLSAQLISRITAELVSLARTMPATARRISIWANETITPFINNNADYLPQNIGSVVTTSLNEFTKTLMGLATTITTSVAGGALATAFSLPEIILSVVLTIMGTFYISYDKERIFAFFRRVFPAHVVNGAISLKRNVFSSVFGQIKSQLLVSLLVTITMILGLLIIRVRYWLVIGLLIGVADALPIIGAGLFLLTWAALSFVTGETVVGVGMLLLYLAVILVRQVAEPRIVGKNLGLYPLATMMALYAGFKLMGVLGMLAGPIVLNVLKSVLAADEGLLQPPERPEKPAGFKKRFQLISKKKG